ncbi:MAG TPA: hypothetical protein ENI07_16055 [Desulfobacterales bacterium]|nr:hypothetical protein [Desulfobacterales bacterium]
MKILIACEYSGIVRDAFIARGHDAMSCDLLPTESPGPHYQGDVFNIINDGWDMMIGFPPCTFITYAGTRHWDNPGRLENRLEALQFFAQLWLAPVDKICLENPRGCASPVIAKYSQLINPYYFGDSFSKPTCLWLKKLPLLQHSETDTLFEQRTHVDKGEFVEFVTNKGTIKKEAKWYRELGGNSHARSKTFPGIADAMAEQWG